MTLSTTDGSRTARVHHPADAGPGAPLVVVVHPAATSALDMETSFGWDALADRDGFVVAYPEGLLDSFQNTWNGGRCCPPASELHTDDVGFVDTLTKRLAAIDDLGPKVYAVGFSNGAILAYAWACQRPGVLSGIGVVAGALMSDCVHPAALDVVAEDGTADTSIPLAGGPGPDGARSPGLAASLAPFQRADDCPGKPALSTVGAAAVSVWQCGTHRIVQAVVKGMTHQWLGAGPSAGSRTDPSDATGFLWARLRSHG